jgi:hypothetical protein
VEVRRVTCQGPQTVEEFYREMAATRVVDRERRQPRFMLDLLRELSADGPGPVVWGLTSHERLALLAADDWDSRTLVLIEPTPAGTWQIQCALPADRAPWPEAVVWGYTEELAEAVRRVRLGLEWAGLLDRRRSIAEPPAPPDRGGSR